MELQEIREELIGLSGNNPNFYQMITPGAKPIYGVRVPELRKLSKRIAKDNYQQFLEENPLDTFEMEMLQAFVIGYAKDDIDKILPYFHRFVPMVHDWAVSDALCQNFSIARKEQEIVYDALMKYRYCKKEFPTRIVAITLISHFLNDEYVDRILDVLSDLATEDYYSKMGVAWAVATVMAKYESKCMQFMKSECLDDWTYLKSIQKMIESYRVSEEAKQVLRKMREKKRRK